MSIFWKLRTRRFVNHTWVIRVLEDKQLALLLSKRFTKEEWIMLFGAMEQGSYPDWLIAAATPADVPDRDVGDVGDVLGLCSPKQASTRTGIFDVFPALSYDEEDENLKRVEMETTSPEENVQASIQDFKH
jgi:hypothetical protein